MSPVLFPFFNLSQGDFFPEIHSGSPAYLHLQVKDNTDVLRMSVRKLPVRAIGPRS